MWFMWILTLMLLQTLAKMSDHPLRLLLQRPRVIIIIVFVVVVVVVVALLLRLQVVVVVFVILDLLYRTSPSTRRGGLALVCCHLKEQDYLPIGTSPKSGSNTAKMLFAITKGYMSRGGCLAVCSKAPPLRQH